MISPILISTSLLHSAQTVANTSSLWNMIKQGGWAMYPLGISSMALIYLAIHCFRETSDARFGSESLTGRMSALCSKKRVEEAIEAARQDPSLLGKTLSVSMPKFDPVRPDDSITKINESISESIELEDHAVGQWIHYINVIAAVAPMIGLLGTVSGMIGAFQTMSSGGMGRPELLAGDIGEALITTATGLCIGIPAMITHSYFNNRLNNQLVETAQQANQVVDALAAPPE